MLLRDAPRKPQRAGIATRRRSPATGCGRETRRVTAEPGQHKMSLLMVVAALLLMISAALLFTRLKSKPDFERAATSGGREHPGAGGRSSVAA